MRGANRDSKEKFERKRPIRRPRPRWENNIKMDIQEMEWGMDWIVVALSNAVINLGVL